MKLLITILLLAGFGSNYANANVKQAESFMKIYSSLCLKHVNNLEALRNKLNKLPKLPTNKSSIFLSGKKGSAWPVPDKNGTFVIAIPNEQNICMVYARRGNAESAEKAFTALFSKAQKPLKSKLIKDEYQTTAANGKTHSLSYEWFIPKSPKAMMFMLTTASSDTANLQLMASASIIKK